jgi:outer membrane receptor protein involved in Fe transport
MFSPPDSFSTAANPFGGPFYSQAAFENWYDSWSPDRNITSVSDTRALNALGRTPTGSVAGPVSGDSDPLAFQRLTGNTNYYTLRDVIATPCLTDSHTQERLAAYDQTDVDPFDLFNPYCVNTISRNDKWFSPKLTLTKRVNDDLNAYLSWAQSEKPGGFSTLGIGSSGLNRELLEFEPEKLVVYELGVKSQWLDRTLTVNSAFFFQDFTDKQTLVSVLNAAGDRIVNRLENVDGAEVHGLEVDVGWSPMSTFLGGEWNVTAAYTYLNAEYVDAQVVNTSFTFISAAGNCAPTVVTALNGSQAVVCNVSLDGKKLEDAPRGKFVSSIGYNLPLADDLNFFVETDFLWIDKRFIEATNENWVEPDTNVDLRIGLRTDRWDITGYVSNLFDDDTIASAAGGPSLGCCFILGSGIDLAGREPPAADIPDWEPSTTSPSSNEPGKTVIV